MQCSNSSWSLVRWAYNFAHSCAPCSTPWKWDLRWSLAEKTGIQFDSAYTIAIFWEKLCDCQFTFLSYYLTYIFLRLPAQWKRLWSFNLQCKEEWIILKRQAYLLFKEIDIEFITVENGHFGQTRQHAEILIN